MAQAPKAGEYSEGKLWFSRKGAIVTVGLTSMATENLGEVDDLEFPDEGDDFDKSDVMLTIEGNKGSIEVLAPGAGHIHEINEGVAAEPEMLTDDPLEEGWLIRIEVQDLSDLEEYADAANDDDSDEDDEEEEESDEEDEDDDEDDEDDEDEEEEEEESDK